MVLVGSDYAGDLRLDDVNFDKRKYDNNAGNPPAFITLSSPSSRLTVKAYMQSKQANRMLNVAWAKEFAPFNIAVNCYHPGGIKSQLSKDLGTPHPYPHSHLLALTFFTCTLALNLTAPSLRVCLAHLSLPRLTS